MVTEQITLLEYVGIVMNCHLHFFLNLLFFSPSNGPAENCLVSQEPNILTLHVKDGALEVHRSCIAELLGDATELLDLFGI